MRSQLDKASRRALLDKIAAQRKNGTRHELEDSDSDDGSDGPSYSAARPAKPAAVVLESSDEGSGGEERRQTAPRRTAVPGAHRRLLKAAEVPLPGAELPQSQQQAQQRQPGSRYDGGDEDIAAALEQLTIRKAPKPGAGRSTGGGSTAAGSRQARSIPPSDEETAPAGSVDDSKCLVLGDTQEFKLNARISTRLYPHQVEGVRWLWSLYRLRRGGILADDMGLGKTLQCAAFLAGLIESRLIRRAIVVAPKTLLAQWTKELKICRLGSATYEYGGSAGEREHALDRVVFRRGVLLTTYGMVLHNAEVLGTHASHDPDDGPLWDVMICDEGHKLKNPRMQLRKALDALPCALRVIISGTPIQNNLMEMWALFNFVAPDVLGEPADFRDHYEKAITHGSDKHATQYERERGAVAAARLRQEVGPYMLRREKKEVFQSQDDAATAAAASGVGSAASSPQGSDGGAAQAAAAGGASKPAAMPHKNDLIVWLKLKPMQKKVYQAFLNSDSVKKVFNQTASALAAITVLKKVCDHPALLSERAAHGIVSGVNRARRQAAARQAGGSSDVEIIEDSSEGEELEDSEEGEWESDSEDYSSDEERQRQRARYAKRKAGNKAKAQAQAPAAGLAGSEWDGWASPELEQQLLDEVHTTGFEASCKTVFVMGLLKQLVAEGHRTLVFSQSRVMLNILEAAVKEERWRYCRIDGSVTSAAERQARVHQFQTSPSIPLFLLTSQVGGLGLTLTAADRVIILDPAWNPSTDNQSVDRAYRIGQTKDVVVYRLISCGTVEEKIYRRQVFKGGLSRTGMEEGEQFRYFAQEELRDLFRLEPSECESSRTQRELHAMHAHQRRETPELRAHLEFLKKLDCYAGVSDHDLLFSKKEREAPPQQPGSFTKPAAASRSAAAASSSGIGRAAGAGASPRKGVFAKTATQGWSGSSELSDLFAKRLSIGGGAGGSAAAAAAAQPPGHGWGGQGGSAAAAPAAQQPRLSDGAPSRDRLLEHVEELEEALERKRHLLTLSSGLADGGARVRLQIAELEAELAAAKQKAAGPSCSTASPPASSAGAAPSVGGPVGSAAPAPRPPLPSSFGATAGTSGAGRAGLPSASGASSGNAAVGRQLPPAAPAAPVAATAPAAAPLPLAGKPPAATAAAPAPPPAKPAASPLLARVRDLLFGSGKKAAPPAGSSAAAAAAAASGAEGGGRALVFGGQAEPSSGSAGSVIDLSGPDADAPSTSFTTATSQPASGAPVPRGGATQPRQALAPRADNGGSSGGSGADGAAGQPAKAPLSLREVKHRLMETLKAIKEAEGGGYYDRAHVDKLRRRAAKLNQRYEEAKAEAAAAAGAAR